MSRLQLKLMIALTGLVAAIILPTGLLAERGLQRRELARIERSLAQRARLVRDAAIGLAFLPTDAPSLDAWADRLGAAAEARVTLIASNGTVVGDSEVPLSELPLLENHASRPEVREALAGRKGQSARLSTTLTRRLLYMALPQRGPDDRGVVRLAVPLDQIDAAAAALRRQLLGAGALGLLAALLLSYVISWLTLRPVRELHDVVGAIADGDLERRLGRPRRDELGEISTAINRVAEQLRRRLDQATAEKDRLAAVLSSMVEGVLVLEDHRITLVNPRLRELLGAWGPVEGRSVLEVVRITEVESALREALESDAPVVRELDLMAPAPRHLLMHAVGFPASGPRSGVVAVFHDVTELHRLERVRTDFIANASHELRTPLTAIHGFSETLLESPVSEEQNRSYLQAIARNAMRLSHLVDDLLALSRIESRRDPLRPCEVDLVSLCRTLREDLEPRLVDANVRIDLRGDDAAPAWVDRSAAQAAITNLVDNALKYSDCGGQIEIKVASDESCTRVHVRDSGIGIPEAECGRIFERFYRVDAARSRALGGTGLGLAIVKHLVEAMGGTIDVESRLGEGSCFTIALPRNRPGDVETA